MTDFASDFAAAFLNSPERDDAVPEYQDDDLRSDAGSVVGGGTDPATKARSLRRGLVKAANIQDMLLEK